MLISDEIMHLLSVDYARYFILKIKSADCAMAKCNSCRIKSFIGIIIV